jgi:hypothetical protein
MLFTGPISDWIGLLEDIAFNGDIERVGHSIHDNFDIPGDWVGSEMVRWQKKRGAWRGGVK